MTIGNPAPLGLLAFGMTTAMLMYVELGWAETESKAVVAGFAIWYGGAAQALVGIFELFKGSSFSFAVFGSYGAFWLAWANLYNENFIRAQNEMTKLEYEAGHTAMLAQWGILTLLFCLIALRKNVCVITVLGLLALTFFLLSAADGSNMLSVQRAAGAFGFATAIAAIYTAIAELVNEEWGSNLLPGLMPLHAPERIPITKESVMQRISYDARSNTMMMHFRGMQIKTLSDVQAIKEGVETSVLNVKAPDNKVHAVVDYKGVQISDDVFIDYWSMVSDLERKCYLSAKRFHVTSFGTPRHGSVIIPTSPLMRDANASRHESAGAGSSHHQHE